MMEIKRILIATFSFPSLEMNYYDGKFVLSEAIAYAKTDAKVKVVTPHFKEVNLREKIGNNIEVIRFRYFCPSFLQRLRRPGVPLYNQRSFLAIFQIPFLCLFYAITILKYAKWADIIHAQWTLSALLAFPSKWLYGKKVILTARGTDLRSIPKWINQIIHKHSDAAIDCFGPQPRNEAYKKTFSGLFVKLPLIVHIDSCNEMPLDMKTEIENINDIFVMLYTGRLDRFKLEFNKLPIINLIKACKEIDNLGHNFHLFYVGDGQRDVILEMKHLITDFGLLGRISMLGGKMNATDYMHFCDIGIGGVAFNAVSQEYTLLGKPQILVKIPDNERTPWKDMVNVLFVRPDSIENLVEKIVWAITHRNELRNIGMKAKNQMRSLMVDSDRGGAIYLKAFAELSQNRL